MNKGDRMTGVRRAVIAAAAVAAAAAACGLAGYELHPASSAQVACSAAYGGPGIAATISPAAPGASEGRDTCLVVIHDGRVTISELGSSNPVPAQTYSP